MARPEDLPGALRRRAGADQRGEAGRQDAEGHAFGRRDRMDILILSMCIYVDVYMYVYIYIWIY